MWYIVYVKISLNKVEYECRRRDLSVGDLLREAGVSRNAFYSLARKDYVVPLSLIRIASRLDISVSDLLEETATPAARMKAIAAEAALLVGRYPEVDPDNVRHTLILLSEKPVERLRRALRRGRFVDIR
jgi:AcrR family transcriptional regulator